MHAQDQIGPVELATISFGQSFQITPIQLAATVSSLINGGTRITPHLGLYCEKTDGSERISVQKETEQKRILSEETSARLRSILFQVVENGGGKMEKSKAIGGRRRRPARRFLAVLVGIFLRFWVLPCGLIRRCWHCALSETPKASIMVVWWRRRWCVSF
ncbi:MAG: penicillin-binding transpeptidase domain-containing protein [Gallintestinimicrobium sp.]